MSQLVNDLLDVSRITQGKIELRRERLRIADVLQDAIDAVRPMIEERNHTLALTLPDPLPMVFADRIRMTQVLENLLSNACKYTDAGGRIGVELEQAAAEVVIRVRDTGIGIAPAQLGHVFELFTQIDTAMDRAQGGLGIGLALVRSLVLLHGGTVTAHSEGLGKGACFEVRLPANPASAVAKP
jgi:signal transduction histidine kinase